MVSSVYAMSRLLVSRAVGAATIGLGVVSGDGGAALQCGYLEDTGVYRTEAAGLGDACEGGKGERRLRARKEKGKKMVNNFT